MFWPVRWAGASASAGRQGLQALSGRALWLAWRGRHWAGGGIGFGQRAAFPARSHGLSTAKVLRAGRQAPHYTISMIVLLHWAFSFFTLGKLVAPVSHTILMATRNLQPRQQHGAVPRVEQARCPSITRFRPVFCTPAAIPLTKAPVPRGFCRSLPPMSLAQLASH